MVPARNLPLLLNLSYYGFNRGLTRDLQPIFNSDKTVKATFCNKFIQYVCNGLGYTEFSNMLANEMHNYMCDQRNGWIVVSDYAAIQSNANKGVLTVASHATLNGHGHICLIIPGILEKSHAWNEEVPKCVNVGKDVFYGKLVSFAFTQKDRPTFFCLAGMM